MAKENEVSVTKDSKVSIEILVTLITLTALLVASFVRQEINSKNNKTAIAQMQIEATRQSMVLTTALDKLEETLGGILVEARVKNELEAYRVGDRWTASMMQEAFEDLFDGFAVWVGQLHPEFRPNREIIMPDIDAIQKRQSSRHYNPVKE